MHHFIVDILLIRKLTNFRKQKQYFVITKHTIRFLLAEEKLLFSIIPKSTNF